MPFCRQNFTPNDGLKYVTVTSPEPDNCTILITKPALPGGPDTTSPAAAATRSFRHLGKLLNLQIGQFIVNVQVPAPHHGAIINARSDMVSPTDFWRYYEDADVIVCFTFFIRRY
jgi:hypothetical protein